jgi:hypothetical protein
MVYNYPPISCFGCAKFCLKISELYTKRGGKDEGQLAAESNEKQKRNDLVSFDLHLANSQKEGMIH